MISKNILIFFLFFVTFSINIEAQQKKVVCYWYPGISTTQIDANICTHIIFSFLGIQQDGELTYLDRSEASVTNYLQQAVQLKSKNSNLKIIAAIGGWNDNLVYTWSNLAGSSTARNNLALQIYNFIQKHNIDGIDIDWEFPNRDEDRSADKQNFIPLLQAIKARLGTQYSLSIAIGTGAWRTDLSYDVKAMFGIVDFVNVMTYDMHGGWERKTGLHSALYRSSIDNTPQNVDDSIKLLLGYEVDKSKIIVGIPAYGYAFTLENANNNGINAPASSTTAIVYREICQQVQSGAYTYRWEEIQRVPYAFKDTLWVGYDNVRSVTEKANYINTNGLGGAMFWAIDNDDYDGICGEGKYPLISTAYKILSGNSNQIATTMSTSTTTVTTGRPTTTTTTTTTSRITSTVSSSTSTIRTTSLVPSTTTMRTTTWRPPTTRTSTVRPTIPRSSSTLRTTAKPVTSTKPPTTSKPTTSFKCPSNGIFKDPLNCKKFFNCAMNVPYHKDCPTSLYFNDAIKNCDYTKPADCP